MSDFLTPSKFEALIDQMVNESDYTYVEAIIEYCEENGVDEDQIAKSINPNLKRKLEADAIRLNYLPKKGDLDLQYDD